MTHLSSDPGGTVTCVLSSFLQALFESGDVTVPGFGVRPVGDKEALNLLRGRMASVLSDLPDQEFEFRADSALWAATQFFTAAQCIVCRDVSAENARDVLASQCPESLDASVVFSVDLVYSFLPSLLTLSTRIAPSDPVTEVLRHWCTQWPLSSVGTELGSGANIELILTSPALLRLYLDRIQTRAAIDRLADSRIRTLVEQDLGLHDDLAPSVARNLRSYQAAASPST